MKGLLFRSEIVVDNVAYFLTLMYVVIAQSLNICAHSIIFLSSKGGIEKNCDHELD